MVRTRPPGPQRDPERDQQIIAYALAGVSPKDIALMLGTSRQTIENTLHHHGYQRAWRWVKQEQTQ